MAQVHSRRIRHACIAAALVCSGAGSIAGIAAAPASATAVGPVLTSASSTYVTGQNATFTLTVPTLPKTVRATGSATFTVDDGAAVGAIVVVSSGKAVFKTTTLDLGTHEVSVAYSGDANYPSGGAGPVSVEILAGSTTTSLTNKLEPVPTGKAASIAALVRRVAPAKGDLTGTMTFTVDDGSVVAPVTVPVSSSGAAQYRPKLADGTYSVHATYDGNGRFTSSAATPVTLHVGPVPPPVSTVDQQNTTYAGIGHTVKDERGSRQDLAQTFTASRTGTLDKVTLYLEVSNVAQTPALSVSIRTTSGGLPTSTVLASTTVAAADAAGSFPLDITFPTGAAVTAGTQYAIYLEITAPQTMGNWWDVSASNAGYPGGAAMSRENGGSWSIKTASELLFKTWVK